MILWAALIAMSTVMVRQHYVADIAGGLILAFATSVFFLRLMDRTPLAAGGAPAAPSAA